MQAEEVKKLIEAQLPQCIANIESQDGSHFTATIVATEFIGKSKVQQQQLVYKALKDLIANNSIHAISLKTYTPEDWAVAKERIFHG